MRLPVMCSARSLSLLLGIALVLPMLRPGAAVAQEADDTAAQFELDLARMLFEDNAQMLRDPVWSVRAGPGKKIVLIPFTVNQHDKTIDLSRAPISLRGARFIGFYVPPADQHQARAAEAGPDFKALAAAKAEDLDKILFGDPEEESRKESPAPGDDPVLPTDGEGDPEAKPEGDDRPGPAPETAPRLARKLKFHPDQTVEWSMDRSFPSAEVQGAGADNLYPYKLDPKLLEAQQPPKGERVTRNDGEDAREYAQRRKEAQLVEREAQKEFRDLRAALRDLPTDFREPAPKVVYAVLEVAERGAISLEGPGPLSWSLSTEAHEQMQQLASGQLRPADDVGKKALEALAKLAEGKHANDLRGIAIGILRGNLVDSIEQDDAGFKLIAKMLAAEDTMARRTVQYAVARTPRPTRVSAALLEAASRSAVTEEREMLQVASQRTLFGLEAAKPESAGFLISKVNEAIADPSAIAPARVLNDLLNALGKAGASGGGSPESMGKMLEVMAGRMDAGKLTGEHFDAVVNVLISQAPTNMIAAGLLDQAMLQSAKPDHVIRTLELLGEAQLKVEFSESDPSQEPRLLTIPMASKQSGLIKSLLSVTERRKALAWAALPKFHIIESRAVAQEGVTPATPVEIFDAILKLASEEAQAPASVVSFIANQRERSIDAVAPRRLLELLSDADADDPIAKAAAEEILRSGDRYGEVLQRFVKDEQVKVVLAMYGSMTGSAPLVVGLIAEQSDATVTWFRDQLKQGVLPSAQDWAAQAANEVNGGEARLISLAASEEDGLAVAAAAALVLNAGGGKADQKRFARDVSQLETRSLVSVKEVWGEVKKDLYGRVLANAQGTYKLVVTLTKPKATANQPIRLGETEPAPDAVPDAEAGVPKPEQGERYDLGLVELTANDGAVALSIQSITTSMTPNRLGIRISKLESFASLGAAGLVRLDKTVVEAVVVDLLPQPDGSWSGQAALLDETQMTIALVPVP